MGTIEIGAEHALLRSLVAEVENALGRASGIGWDDIGDCDMKRLLELENRLSRELENHQALVEGLCRHCGRPARGKLGEVNRKIDHAHAALHDLLALLRTVSCLCNGRHFHAVRTAAGRVRAELEDHLEFEQRTLFPLLARRRTERPARSIRLSAPRR